MRRWLSVVLGVLGLGVLGVAVVTAPALAGGPAALIVGYSGTQAALSPYTEISDGAVFTLGTDTVSFVHYQTCKTVEVRGGKLTVTEKRFDAEGGVVRDLNQEQCPEEVTVKTAGVAGGVVLRAIGAKLVPSRLECVLAGEGYKYYRAIQIFDDARLLTEIPLNKGAQVIMPRSAPSLENDKAYRLVLLPRAEGQTPASVRVTVSSEADKQVCLIRLD
ncbi:MAG: hypothetical protein H7840_04825 [Alphaproteobacteria bacterium]